LSLHYINHLNKKSRCILEYDHHDKNNCKKGCRGFKWASWQKKENNGRDAKDDVNGTNGEQGYFWKSEINDANRALGQKDNQRNIG